MKLDLLEPKNDELNICVEEMYRLSIAISVLWDTILRTHLDYCVMIKLDQNNWKLNYWIHGYDDWYALTNIPMIIKFKL